jgi:hypothetical protein
VCGPAFADASPGYAIVCSHGVQGCSVATGWGSPLANAVAGLLGNRG